MENQTYEQEVDLKDLILAILRRWRSIIVVGILMAVVMGGYAAVSGSRAGEEEPEDGQQTYEDALALLERIPSEVLDEFRKPKAARREAGRD